MRLGWIKERLLPGAAEKDEGFCQEIFRLSHLGLEAVGRVEAGAAIVLALAYLLARQATARPMWLAEAVALGAVGAVSLMLARAQWSYEWSRLLASASVFCGAVALIGFSSRAPGDFVLCELTCVMLVAVAALPLRPAHTLEMGASLAACHALFAGPRPGDLVFLALLTAIATGLTAAAYHQRQLSYGAYIQIMRACEDLRETQSRMLVSENATSMARLAAALSHELNTPMGALLSGVDTLLLLAAKQATSPPSAQERLVRLQADLRRSVEDSAKRLKQTVARMQRFTNLDKSEVQPANLNDLLGDVAALLQPQIEGKAKLEFDFQSVPTMLCRPQQLSAVFSNLLSNAVGAMEQQGRIVVSTRQCDSQVEVQIRDDGRGVAPEQARSIFDPGFKTVEGRVLTGNWSMFNSRQIIREHGGDIRIASYEGRGTTVTVTLPVENKAL